MHEADLGNVMDTEHEIDDVIADIVKSALNTMQPSSVSHLRSEAARIAGEQNGDANEKLANLVFGSTQALSADDVENNTILQSFPTWADAVTLYTSKRRQATLTSALVEHITYENEMTERHCINSATIGPSFIGSRGRYICDWNYRWI